MGALSTLNPTLMDVARRTDPDGKIATIVELLNENNGVLDDMTFIECNDGTNHQTTIRTGLPSGTWRKLYQGVQPQKSTSKQVKDSCGMLEARSQIDEKLSKLNGNSEEWRLSEERPFFEGLNQDIATSLFYGDTDTNPERFMGLAPRFNAHGIGADEDKMQSGFNVLDGGGAGADNTSVWFTVWGPNTMHGIYPKGFKAGLEHMNLGAQEVDDGSGGRYTVLESKFQWDVGLCVRDWRSVVRVANLDVSALNDNVGAQNLLDIFTIAYHRQKGRNLGRAVIYCNATVLTALDRQVQEKTNLNLTYQDFAGKPVLMYRGIPIRECEAILDTEAKVPALA